MTETTWKEAKDPQGRIYFYNTATSETTWTKPQELYSELERRLLAHGWKVGSTAGKQTYYYNEASGESRWELPVLPDQEQDVQAKAEIPVRQDKEKGPRQNQNEILTAVSQEDDKYHNKSSILYVSPRARSEAESVFMQMLKDHQIDSTWSFNRIISELSCKDARYWCIDDDPLWKQQMFEKYLSNRSEDQLLKEHAAVSKFKDAFITVLSNNDTIRYYTRWPTAKRLISNEPIYKHSVVSERVKRETFQEYIDGLCKEHTESQEKLKKQALQELREYLSSIMPDKEEVLSWSELSTTYLFENSERFMANKHFEVLTREEILQEYISMVEKFIEEYQLKLEHLNNHNYRNDRIARDGFKDLLKELGDKIRSTSRWDDVYPLMRNDSRFLAMLGRNGSSALDLFLDLVEEKTLVINGQKNIGEQLLIDAKFSWSEDADEDHSKITAIISGNHQFQAVDELDIEVIVSQIVKAHQLKLQKEKEIAQRLLEQRKQYFRLLLQRFYGMGRPKPEKWEDAEEQLKNFPEFADLDDRQLKIQIFQEFKPNQIPQHPVAPPNNPRKRHLTPVELDY